MLFDLFKRIIQGGTGSLRSYEQSIVDSVANSLDPEAQTALSEQVSKIHLVQREVNARMVVIFYKDESSLGLLERRDLDYCLATVTLLAEGKNYVANVMTNKGVLSSIEFVTPPKGYRNKIEHIDVELAPETFIHVARQINAEEHGDDWDE